MYSKRRFNSVIAWSILIGSAFVALMYIGCETQAGDDDPGIATERNALGGCFERDRRFQRQIMEGEIEGADGETLRYKKYEHVGPDEAYVIFINGFADFIEKYEFLFTARNEYPGRGVPASETLADLPVTFFSLDLVGHGESSGIPSHVDSVDTYVANVKALVDHVWKLKHHIRPIILMSHSMGGLVSARFAQVYPEYIDAIIASSPMWGIQDPPGIPAGFLRGLAEFYVAAGLGELCVTPPGIDLMSLAAIAACHADPTLNACFNDPSVVSQTRLYNEPPCSKCPQPSSSRQTVSAIRC